MKKISSSLRYFIGIFLAGIAVGIFIDSLYRFQKYSEMEQQSAELVDFVIAHWTDIDPYESMERIDASHNAQFTAKKELPQSRLGFFPDTVKILASIIDSKYKIPASVTLAQWALESSWGKNNLGVSNYFGHTFPATGRFTQLNRWVTRTETIHNKRTLRFTVYKNIAECFDVHGKYLSTSKLYRAAFYTNTPENFTRVLAMHYAEDPDYATKLITIMRRYKLEGV